MGKLKKYLLATGCLVILAGALTLFSPIVQQGQALPPTRDVNVVNPPESPIPVVVQNGDTDGTVELVEFIELNLAPGAEELLFTVPMDKRLHITDVIVSSQQSGAKNAEIIRGTTGGPEVVSHISVPVKNDGTYEHSYVSGIVFNEGESLTVKHGETGVSAINWELRGFLETLPSP